LPKQDFEKLLLEAIDEGLSSLGESSKQAIYYHLEKGFNLKKQEIPYSIEAFACAIEKIFGLGANFLKILIMKRLYEKMGRNLKLRASKNLEFTEYITAARQSFLKKTPAKKRKPVKCKEIVAKGS